MTKFILTAICLTFILSSCADELNLYPHASISPEGITEKDLPALRNGMYNSMQNQPRTRSFILFDILGGTLTNANSNPIDLINGMLSPLNGTIYEGWSGYYSALYDVNNVIGITENIPSSRIRDLVKGEAHYFRAYIYFCLTTRWGAVPIIKKNTMELVKRDPVDQVWSFIESELDEAITLLNTSTSYYYVSNDAAVALKARVMLSQGKKDKAAELAERLITSGRYKLDSFDKIFRKKQNSEIIFAFENLTMESSINISDLFYNYSHPNKGQRAYLPSIEATNMFESGDKRKDISLDNVGGLDCINKYPSGQTGTDPVIISRIAELYLISAEAQGRNNGLNRLNELRLFRGVSAVYPTTDNEYLEAILKERKLELIAENFIYHDLVRTGKAKEHLGIQDYQLLLPIPGKELQLNKNLTPNPGY